MKKKIAVFGSLTKDIFVLPSQNKKIVLDNIEYFALPYGGKVVAENIEEHFGGGASNVSIGLQRLGHETFIFGAIGNGDIGKNIIKNLKKENINTKYIQKIDNKKSGFSIILNSYEGERTVIFTSEANKEFISCDTHQFKKENIDALYLCHLSSKENNTIFSELYNFLKKNTQIIFAWNPGKERIGLGIEENEDLLSQCDFLFINKEESEKFTNQTQRKKIIKIFLEQGVKNIIITDGGNGAYLYTDDKEFYFPPEKQNKKDTLGAGDSFASGFFASILHEKPLQECGKYASINAASVVSYIGAQQGLLHYKKCYSKI